MAPDLAGAAVRLAQVRAAGDVLGIQRGFEENDLYANLARVRAHVLVAALALLLDRALEKKLPAAGSSLSSPAAWQALETVRCVTVEAGNRTKLCVTRGSRRAAEALRTLRLTELDPPEPPAGKETVM